jgi:hypothetical protein
MVTMLDVPCFSMVEASQCRCQEITYGCQHHGLVYDLHLHLLFQLQSVPHLLESLELASEQLVAHFASTAHQPRQSSSSPGTGQNTVSASGTPTASTTTGNPVEAPVASNLQVLMIKLDHMHSRYAITSAHKFVLLSMQPPQSAVPSFAKHLHQQLPCLCLHDRGMYVHTLRSWASELGLTGNVLTRLCQV